MFSAFIPDTSVTLVGVEAAGKGLHTEQHGATLQQGSPGIFHGTKSLFLQTPQGHIAKTHSLAAGLDYPGVGPEHAYLQSINRAQYVGTTDTDALKAFQQLATFEGILPALESSHALAYALKVAERATKEEIIIVNLSGRGDKDMDQIMRSFS